MRESIIEVYENFEADIYNENIYIYICTLEKDFVHVSQKFNDFTNTL